MTVLRAPRPISVPLDRIEAARNVVLHSGRMSLLADSERAAIMDLAWSTLREDHIRRCGPPVKPGPQGADVVSLARKRIAKRDAQRDTPLPRRPRIIVRPAPATTPDDSTDPTTPGDAA